MKLFGYEIKLNKSSSPAATSQGFGGRTTIPTGVIISEPWTSFDGEKTAGELGRPVNVTADYRALRMRAYEVDLKADLVRAMTSKFIKWTIGEGLKLESNPKYYILQQEKIAVDTRLLKKQCEERFNLLAYSKNTDYSKMKNLHQLAEDAFSDSFLGGDCLFILRVEENGYPSAQIIDGGKVKDPYGHEDYFKIAENKGNFIKHGIEVDKRGTHVAYYVETINNGFERVPAFIELENGFIFRAARMIYGRKHRINDLRGISSLTSIIEKIDKLDRFSEASVAAAEERANIVYAIEHNQHSTGENPNTEKLLKNVGVARDGGVQNVEDPYNLGEKTSKRIVETTSKQAFNMPIGSKLSVLDSDAEFNYDKFLNSVFDHLCAALDIPPEVALQKYSSNYSASRAAINAWQHILKIARGKFSEEFYQPYYELFFHCQCIMGKLEGGSEYLKYHLEDDFLIKDSFTNARFTGVNMPHIDPLKEVKAIREMLGSGLENMPLISLDQATEQLNQGDWEENNFKLDNEMGRLKNKE